VSRCGIVWSIFFGNSINSERYVDTFYEIPGQLNEQQIAEAQSQKKDSAIFRATRVTISGLPILFGDGIISEGLWPPRSL
jgi:hypothetical protein